MQDLQWAFRSLRRSPGFAALAVGTLTLGIAAATVAFAVLDTVLLRPLPYREPDQLVLIRERTDKQALLAPSYPNFVSWRDGSRAFAGVVSTTFPAPNFVWPGSVESDALPVTALGVSRHFFATLGVAPAVGREFTDDENAPGGPTVVMVSYEFWQSQMGARQPLGTIGLNSGERAPVVGVLAPTFQFRAPAELYYPHEHFPEKLRNAHNYIVVARLKPGVRLAAARSEMTMLSQRLLAAFGTETQAIDTDVIPLRDYLVSDYRTLPPIVFGAAALVLLIACTNLMSAQLARGRAREREVVVRAALGASRSRLVRQLVAESLIVSAAGAALATIVSLFAVRAIKGASMTLMPRLAGLTVDGRVLTFASAIAVLTSLLVGAYPAVRLANRDAGLVLRDGRASALAVRASAWRLLVGFQVALALVLLVGSTLLIETLHNILTSDTGFEAHGVLTISMTQHVGDESKVDRLIEGLRAMPGVRGAAVTTRLPLAWETMSAPLRRVGDPPDHDWPATAGFRVVSPEYFGVLRQPLLRGRAFTPADREGAGNVVIVTPGVAKLLWPGEDPIGRVVSTNFLFDQWLTVVGVAAEASSWMMPPGLQNEIYVPVAQHPKSAVGQLFVIVRTASDPRAVVPAARETVRQILPGAPTLYGTMDERIARTAADRRFAMLALTAFGAIALALAAVGIYGVIWYIVSARTREIGIRMALGATAHTVRSAVLQSAALMAIPGIVVGVLGSALATRYLQSVLYGVSRLDVRVYAGGAAITIVTAMAAAFVPARRSSRVDPMIAMRAE
ncbi:MAG: ABC transporter permease [Gemmatimonadota bacterium]|nr:ABC transporter permease [Gemmatimonadota bacterium]